MMGSRWRHKHFHNLEAYFFIQESTMFPVKLELPDLWFKKVIKFSDEYTKYITFVCEFESLYEQRSPRFCKRGVANAAAKDAQMQQVVPRVSFSAFVTTGHQGQLM